MNEIENQEFTFLSRKILDLNKQLMESEKVKTRFLSLIANELNNPMTALLGMLPHLAPKSGDPKEPTFELVHEEALLLGSRIQNLVVASEIESGIIDVAHASVDLKVLVNEALEEFKYKLKRKNIVVIVESSLKTKIVSDPKKLYLILKNIIANACDYGDSDATVHIGIDQKDSDVTIAINNKGHGLNVKHKAEIFTRFTERMDKSHGLGLGLSIARELCTLLDGKIDYETNENDVTFIVTLPFTERLATSEACGSNEFLFESFDGAIEL